MTTDATRHLRAALRYAEHGLAVFPCQVCGKEPRTKNGFKDATADSNAIRRWWTEHPDANIGLPAELNNLLVLDIDPRNGGDVTLAALGVTDWPQTPTADTGGGGVHLVFRRPDWTPLSKADEDQAGKGYDVKFNGYIVVAPSVHPSGGEYRWRDGMRPWDLEPAVVPDWLEKLIRVQDRPPGGAAVTRKPTVADPDGRLTDREVAEAALRQVNGARADDYHDWLKVGMALHAADEGLLPAWDEWSRTSPKWDEGVCAEKWRTFHGDHGVTLGTLVELARQDGDPDFLRPGWRVGHPAEQAPHARQEAPGGARGAREGDEADAQRLPDVGHCPPGRHRCDDIGNAERLVALCGDRLRYCHDWKTWLFYDGTRWAVDTAGAALACAKAVARSILREAHAAADETQRQNLAKHAAKTASRPMLDAMLHLATPELAIASNALDADPNLLNCCNGVIDLHTGELRPHRPELHLTRRVEADYRPDADLADSPAAALWTGFLSDATNGDAELTAYLQRAAGYTLTGDPNEEAMFFAYGPARTGKSTFLESLRSLLGNDYSDSLDFGALLRRREGTDARPEIAKLQGKRLAVAVEASGRRDFEAELIKWLVGGETISARALHQNPVSWRPQFTLWLAANDRPKVPHDDTAVWRRLRVLPLVHQVPEERVDRDLKRRLREECADVILAWCVRGCLAWRQNGLGTCAAVEEATGAYREAMDPLGDWLSERCDVRPANSDWFTPTAALFKSYRDWCQRNGEREAVTQKQLGEHLAHALKLKHVQRRVGGARPHGYEGIRLTAQPEFAFDDDPDEAPMYTETPNSPCATRDGVTGENPLGKRGVTGVTPSSKENPYSNLYAGQPCTTRDSRDTRDSKAPDSSEVDPFASEDPLPPLTPDEGARW
jgi:putative DNA primase/helicase